MADGETIAVYDEQAEEYSAAFMTQEPDAALIRFMDHLPAGGTVLDFGCGPGEHAAAMKRAGFHVTATDASASMVDMARKHEGVVVRHATFEELDDVSVFDGVWANFSLLHARREDFPAHLGRIKRSLKPCGHLHLGLKTGTGESRDRLGRRYTFFSEPELRDRLAELGFDVVDVKHGEGTGLAGDVSAWVLVIARLGESRN